MKQCKSTDEMAFFVPELEGLKVANSNNFLGTVQPNEYGGLSLKCPISVEEGTGGGGDIGDVVTTDYISDYRLQFITPQHEIHYSYIKLDRALTLTEKTFNKTSYSKMVKDYDQTVINTLLDEYIHYSNKQRIHRKKHLIVLNMIVANLIQAYFSKRLLLTSRHNGVEKKDNPLNFDNRMVAELCDWLSSQHYIELMIQPSQSPLNETVAQSVIHATEKLIRLVSNYRVMPVNRCVILRDSNHAEIKVPNKKSVLLKAKAYEKIIYSYLNLMADTLVTLGGRELSTIGRRVFNRNIDLGGRFYADYQNIPSDDRKRIKINLQKTIELDYKTLHYNLLYSMVDEKLKGDPYIVEGHNRTAIKVISLQLLNTEGEDGLSELARMVTLSGRPEQIEAVKEYDHKRGIYERLTEKGLRVDAPYKPKNVKYHIDCIPEGTDGKQLVKDLLDRHSPIKHLIGSKDIGLRLQNMDSNIMKDIMRIATDEGIPMLTVHDSCICTYDTRHRVKEIMRQVYNDVTGVGITVTQPKRR